MSFYDEEDMDGGYGDQYEQRYHHHHHQQQQQPQQQDYPPMPRPPAHVRPESAGLGRTGSSGRLLSPSNRSQQQRQQQRRSPGPSSRQRPQSASPSKRRKNKKKNRKAASSSLKADVQSAFMNTKQGLLRLAAQMRDSQQQSDELHAKKEATKQAIQDTRRAVSKVDSEIADSIGNQEKLHRECIRLSTRTKDMLNDNWTINNKANKLQKEVDAMKRQRDQRRMEIDRAREEINVEGDAIESLENLIVRMKSELTRLKSERDEYQAQAVSSSRSLAHYRNKVQQWQTMNAGFQQIFTDVEQITA
eukprot:TRINITY_DN68053_c9_g1_i1.p2 TRINITY_DN68053_c9_g1~~TRINITY_DN68053_c9_g1_i1.p2  ORF type:complete len:316 (-),score=145.41 TRINITY_DN68053_c9_g1_i1:38-949(-)